VIKENKFSIFDTIPHSLKDYILRFLTIQNNHLFVVFPILLSTFMIYGSI